MVLLFTVCALTAQAQQLAVELELPQLTVAEYHRPYVALWIADERRKPVQQLALWLEQEKWHRDLRLWWRRGGRGLSLPIDGVSGATRKPGRYNLEFQLSLPPGKYSLNVEAVREVGGREVLQLPFEWRGEKIEMTASGSRELGAVQARLQAKEKP